jgi:hypothetical protein
MNNTFNLKRFLLYFKKHTIENGKSYFLSIVVLLGMLLLLLGFAAFNYRGKLSPIWQMIVFIYGGLIGSCIFTSVIFAELGSKKQAIAMLTLPVSNFEKYLVAWIYSYIIFQVVYIPSFYLVDHAVIALSTPPLGEPNKAANLWGSWPISFEMYALLHSFTFLGAIYFEKLHFIKTSFVFIISFIAFTLIGKPLLLLIGGGHVSELLPFFDTYFIADTVKYNVHPDMPIKGLGIYIVATTVLLFWLSTFFKLKEKQV